MTEAKRYSYSNTNRGLEAHLPFVRTQLINLDRKIKASALLDTGSSVNVLPYDAGLQFPVILGQVNFFQQFRVLFDGKSRFFELTLNE